MKHHERHLRFRDCVQLLLHPDFGKRQTDLCPGHHDVHGQFLWLKKITPLPCWIASARPLLAQAITCTRYDETQLDVNSRASRAHRLVAVDRTCRSVDWTVPMHADRAAASQRMQAFALPGQHPRLRNSRTMARRLITCSSRAN